MIQQGVKTISFSAARTTSSTVPGIQSLDCRGRLLEQIRNTIIKCIVGKFHVLRKRQWYIHIRKKRDFSRNKTKEDTYINIIVGS